MASKKQVAGKKKTNDETSKKTQGSLSNQEKKDLSQKIENLEDENKRLRFENDMFRNKFDLREIIKVFSQKGLQEMDVIEMSKDMIKQELQGAEERHTAEKTDMEKKHKEEIKRLRQTLQGEDQMPTQSKVLEEAEERNKAEKTDMEKNHKKEIERLRQNMQEDQMSTQSNGESMPSKKTDEEIEKYMAEIKKLKSEIDSLKTDKDELKNKHRELTTEKESLTNQQKKSVELLSKKDKEITDLKKEVSNLTTRLKEVEKEKDNLNQQIKKLINENNELQYRLKESQSPPLSKVNENMVIQQLKDENESLRSRLSEYAGAQMTHNNPNIADLSDVFRPTKLSEEYSQLYDNMWTDAFEEHNGKKEDDVIQMLRKGLLSSYEFCEKVCKEFTVQLTNSTLALPNSKPKSKLQELPIVYQKQLQDMKKSFGVFLKNDVKESYRKNHNSIEGGDNTKKYIDACVELSWLMVIQDPPVVIETPASNDSAFDTNTYRAYTTTGPKVDFVVWPALRLHHGGPLLTKGVAQGKK